MITKKEYLKALDIIEQYHKQIRLSVKTHKGEKTLVKDWLDVQNKMSVRLNNGLRFMNMGYYGIPEKIKLRLIYIEDIQKKDFLRLRNLGKKCWEEFTELRGDYND